MDTSTYRTIDRARDLLLDGLGLSAVVSVRGTAAEKAAAVGHGLSADQVTALLRVTEVLWDVLVDDVAPSRCGHCGTRIDPMPATGRPKRFCSNGCREAAAAERQLRAV